MRPAILESAEHIGYILGSMISEELLRQAKSGSSAIAVPEYDALSTFLAFRSLALHYMTALFKSISRLYAVFAVESTEEMLPLPR